MTRCDVVVYGLGLAGRTLLARLAEAGVDVVGHDPDRGWVRPATALAGVAMGKREHEEPCALALPMHLEAPSRFLAAMGKAGVDLVDVLAAHRHGVPTPVEWMLGPSESLEEEVEAARILGLRLDPAPGGFRLLDGTLAADEAGRHVVPSDPAVGELTVHTGGFVVGREGSARPREPWLMDKLMPVRWQSIPVATRGAPVITCSASVFQVADRLWGARWATPHLEVGETDPTPEPRVTAMLDALARQDGLSRGSGPARAVILTESCDGLPIVGPVPGQPRVAAVAGLGVMGRTWLPLVVDYLVAEPLGGPLVRLPACLGTARFR